ncbi:transketolase [candidate division WWE3 bacterium]|nr:transketolase [candidate division WWE3 bacterium]
MSLPKSTGTAKTVKQNQRRVTYTKAGLQKIAHELRIDVLKMLEKAKSGHPASALGTAEIFSVLYWDYLNISPQNAQDPSRDKFILSNGHICPILYATLAKKGFFPETELNSLRKINALLQGHPDRNIPGIETTAGSLGQGLSLATGIALTQKIEADTANTAGNTATTTKVIVMTSDGELNEGQTWEAAMYAPRHSHTPKYTLDNLTWIIDRNNIQISGHTNEVLPLENLREKLESFNWYVLEIDGHNISEIQGALKMAENITSRPTVIIAHTIPGKGVDFMEKDPKWHGKAPNREQMQDAVAQIKNLLKNIKDY